MTQVPPESKTWHRAGADEKPPASGEQIKRERGARAGEPPSTASAGEAAKPVFPEARPREGEPPEATDRKQTPDAK